MLPPAAAAIAGAANAAPHVDFTSLPTSALASYIEYYSLAPNYPPPPPPRASSRTPSEILSDEENDDAVGLDGDEDRDEGGSQSGEGKTEEELLAEASGKRRAALASAAATSTSYSKDNKFRARTPPATTTAASATASGSRKRTAAEMTAENGMFNGRDSVNGEPCPTEFFDDDDAKTYLANIAQKHFAAQPPPKEGEVVVGFLYRCRTKELRYTKWSST